MRMFENIKFLGLYIQVENDGYNSIKLGRLLRIDESERERWRVSEREGK